MLCPKQNGPTLVGRLSLSVKHPLDFGSSRSLYMHMQNELRIAKVLKRKHLWHVPVTTTISMGLHVWTNVCHVCIRMYVQASVYIRTWVRIMYVQ